MAANQNITKEFPIMAHKPEQKESVKSPTSATDPTNLGGMPKKMSVDEIFAENQPPPTPAESSVADLGERAYDGK